MSGRAKTSLFLAGSAIVAGVWEGLALAGILGPQATISESWWDLIQKFPLVLLLLGILLGHLFWQRSRCKVCGNRPWLLLFLLLATPAAAQERGATFGALSTAQLVLSGDTRAVLPGIRLDVRGPFAFGESTPLEVTVVLELTGSPGETVVPGDVATFKAAGLDAGLAREIGWTVRGSQTIRTLIYLEAGFATRLPQDPAPLDRYPRRAALGLEVREESSGAFFKVGIGRNDIAGPAQWRQLMVSGQVPLYGFAKKKGKARARITIGGDVVLTIGRANFGPQQRDVIRISTGVKVGG